MIRGRKEPQALPRGMNPDHGGSSERGGGIERKHEGKEKRVKTHAGDHTRKLFPKPFTGGKERGL